MKSIGHKENSHRYRLTKKYYDPYQSTEERLTCFPPIRISEKVWREFVLSWATTKFLVSKKFTYYIIKFFIISVDLQCWLIYVIFNWFLGYKEKNKENREKERDLHTSGRRGYQWVKDDTVNNWDDILFDIRNIRIF